jgi:hypothetical protein
MPELIDLQAQRRNAIELARGISKKAEEKREMTAEEQENYRSMLKRKIDHEVEQRELDRRRVEMDAIATRPRLAGLPELDVLRSARGIL